MSGRHPGLPNKKWQGLRRNHWQGLPRNRWQGLDQNRGRVYVGILNIELKQLEADQKFEEIFKALESDKLYSEKGIFYNGQVFDAYAFVSDIIRSAKSSIILLDNYVDDTVLTLLGKRKTTVTATILTKSISNQLRLDLQRYNSQYPPIDIEVFSDAHDRFLIIDHSELYHIGTSLKDLGKNWFAFSRMDIELGRVLQILNK